MYNYEEVKHEACNAYALWSLSYSERVIAGCASDDVRTNVIKYREQLRNYITVGQVGIRTTESCGYGRIFTKAQLSDIRKEIELLNVYLG
jgi:hypothetical protein